MLTLTPRKTRRSSGFTLLELVVVLAVVSLMSAAVVFRVQGLLSGARFQAAIDAVRETDRRSRDYCRWQRQLGWLVYDDRKSEVYFRLAAGSEDGQHFTTSLPARINMAVLGPREIERRQETSQLPVSAAGRTPTYAIKLTDRYDRAAWVMFMGGSGQCLVTTDEEQFYATISPSLLAH